MNSLKVGNPFYFKFKIPVVVEIKKKRDFRDNHVKNFHFTNEEP